MADFQGFYKIARWSREITITEKIDGSNGQIYIGKDGEFLVGSRTRWITPENDNHGFAKWAYEHKDELMELGPGQHFGEWWGQGINRDYGLNEKRFSLFNVRLWTQYHPKCCHVVPIIQSGICETKLIEFALAELRNAGSFAMPGFMKPEGIVIYHKAGNVSFKKTLEKDEMPKGMVKEE